jgi:hypothetical protein
VEAERTKLANANTRTTYRAVLEVSLFVSLLRHHVCGKIASNMKNAVFSDVMPCGSCYNRRFGGRYRLHDQGGKISELGKTLTVTTS